LFVFVQRDFCPERFFVQTERSLAMRRKADRWAGRNLKDCKQRGEWAELYFMMLAAGLGMKVSKPFGGTSQYDVGVDRTGGVLRVQAKSTIYTRRNGGYSLNVMGPQREMYLPGTVDFLRCC
jgi:hypothetical protein